MMLKEIDIFNFWSMSLEKLKKNLNVWNFVKSKFRYSHGERRNFAKSRPFGVCWEGGRE